MNRFYFLFVSLLSLSLLVSCSDDNDTSYSEGNPQLTVSGIPSSAFFGDSISFSATVSDAKNVPLSTLKAQLFYGEDMVSETVIRTKTDGDYSGKIKVPFLKRTPNGTATLKFALQNVGFGIEEEVFPLPLTRPSFPHLTLVTADREYKMEKSEDNIYAVTDEFPLRVKGVIKAPAVGERGNEIVFGWKEGAVSEASTENIPFDNPWTGLGEITFNTFDYEFTTEPSDDAPIISFKFAGEEMVMNQNDDNYTIELELTQSQTIQIEGFNNLDEWWIDVDFLTANDDNTFTFTPISGKYRVVANFELKYFLFEVMDGDTTASLNEDGTGAIWIIGTDIGKPSLSNETGWNTDKALCLAPVAEKVYQITVVGGESITAEGINFKFFHQKGWGGEFTNETLSTESDLILVGAGQDVNGSDPGNLALKDGITLEEGATYRITVDLTNGKDNAVMTVEKL